MKILLSSFFIFLGLYQAFSQVEISEILAYEYNNRRNTFTTNVVGKESIDVIGNGNQTLIVVKLNRIPDKEYKYMRRKLKVTAQYEDKDKLEVFEQVEVTVPSVSEIFYVPLIIQQGTTDITIIAELFEEEKMVSTHKQLLVTWSGD